MINQELNKGHHPRPKSVTPTTWRSCPVNATEEMIEAGKQTLREAWPHNESMSVIVARVWNAMSDKSPKPPPDNSPSERARIIAWLTATAEASASPEARSALAMAARAIEGEEHWSEAPAPAVYDGWEKTDG